MKRNVIFCEYILPPECLNLLIKLSLEIFKRAVVQLQQIRNEMCLLRALGVRPHHVYRLRSFCRLSQVIRVTNTRCWLTGLSFFTATCVPPIEPLNTRPNPPAPSRHPPSFRGRSSQSPVMALSSRSVNVKRPGGERWLILCLVHANTITFFTYISALKRLITSNIIISVYMIYVCVRCILIMCI